MQIDGVAATALSEGEFLERVGGRKGSVCVLQLDRDDGGGQSHVVDVNVCRAGVMDEDQLRVPSSYTGQSFYCRHHFLFALVIIFIVFVVVIIMMIMIAISDLPSHANSFTSR